MGISELHPHFVVVFTHSCPISCESINFLFSKALMMVLLFIPKQDFATLKFLMLLEDTTSASTTFLTTYWSFPTLYFKPFYVLVKLLQIMAHCSRFLWFITYLGIACCNIGCSNNLSKTFLWYPRPFWLINSWTI